MTWYSIIGIIGGVAGIISLMWRRHRRMRALAADAYRRLVGDPEPRYIMHKYSKRIGPLSDPWCNQLNVAPKPKPERGDTELPNQLDEDR